MKPTHNVQNHWFVGLFAREHVDRSAFGYDQHSMLEFFAPSNNLKYFYLMFLKFRSKTRLSNAAPQYWQGTQNGFEQCRWLVALLFQLNVRGVKSENVKLSKCKLISWQELSHHPIMTFMCVLNAEIKPFIHRNKHRLLL